MSKATTKRPLRLLDGSYVPLLRAAGVAPECPAVRAVLEHRDAVVAAHRAFVQAGAHILVAHTAEANAFALTRHDLADEAERINRDAVAAAREAAGDAAEVFGAIGPSHLMLSLEEVTPHDLGEAFEAQARTLVDAGVDGIVIEGMIDLPEAVAAIEAVRRVSDLPLAACMTFLPTGETFTTAVDVEPTAASTLAAAGADWVGCHSGVTLTEAPLLLDLLRAATDKPLWVRVDVGDAQYDTEAKTIVHKQTPDDFAAARPDMEAYGITVFGAAAGCTPAHVRALNPNAG